MNSGAGRSTWHVILIVLFLLFEVAFVAGAIWFLVYGNVDASPWSLWILLTHGAVIVRVPVLRGCCYLL